MQRLPNYMLESLLVLIQSTTSKMRYLIGDQNTTKEEHKVTLKNLQSPKLRAKTFKFE